MDAKIKKAFKDLAVPPKPAATKVAIMIADLIRKAPISGQDAMRKQLLQRYEEKGVTWEGGALPVLVTLINQVQEKPMLEAVSLALWQVLIGFEGSEAAGAAKILVQLCKDKSLLVQAHATAALLELGSAGSHFRTQILEAGGLENLTTVIASIDSDEVIAKQGVNKLIAYKPGQRQEAAAGALHILGQELAAQKLVARAGTMRHLISICETCTVPEGSKTREAAAGALFGFLQLSTNRALLVEAGGVPALIVTADTGSEEARMLAAGAIWELSLEVDLRPHLIRAGAVPSLLALCAPGRSDATHAQAAAALAELANEDDAKAAVLTAGGGGDAALRTLTALLQPASSPAVQERALGAVGFLCVLGRRNRLQALLDQSEAAHRALQDAAGPETVRAVVALCRAAGPGPALRVANQALVALAALCYQHERNAAVAAAEGAVAAVVRQLADAAAAADSPDSAGAAAVGPADPGPAHPNGGGSSACPGDTGGGGAGGDGGYGVLRCNAMRALSNLAGAYDANRRRACQLGAGALVLAAWEAPRPADAAAAAGGWPAADADPTPGVAWKALAALRVAPQGDARGNRLAPARLRLAHHPPPALSAPLPAAAAERADSAGASTAAAWG